MDAIKEMAYCGGYRGRGRTIEALVEAVWDSTEYIEAFVRAGIAQQLLQNSPSTDPKQHQERIQQLAFIQTLNAVVIVDRLRKFVGVDANELGRKVKKEFEEQAKARPAAPQPGGDSTAKTPSRY